MRKKEEEYSFADMTLSEIEKWEQDTDSVVLFDDETGIAFQKCKGGNPPALVIMIDGREKPVILQYDQVNNLKSYLNDNF
ncbi:MAG: hypothetical protein FWF54_00710 [Candidatus Azobacteroides sp.]|nr:hypothetical protein [Candidatus Azobacteroides sp.]